MANLEQYKALMTEMIKKQMIILGPDITLLKARNVQGLEIAADGTVSDVKGDPTETIQRLMDEYVELSGLIVKNILNSMVSKYPDIKIKL